MSHKSGNKGFWISIDGTEGVGKSVIAKHLFNVIPGAVLSPEFSDGAVGMFLKDAVKTNPHIIGRSLIGQSLLFLGDFFEIYDTIVGPSLQDDRIVISDRGYLSKYVYQFLVLSLNYPSELVSQMLDSLFQMIPAPDYSLYLTCERQTQVRRLLTRDGHCDKDRVDFMVLADEKFQSLLQSRKYTFGQIEQDASTAEEELLQQSELLVKSFLNNRGRRPQLS